MLTQVNPSSVGEIAYLNRYNSMDEIVLPKQQLSCAVELDLVKKDVMTAK